MSVTVHIVCDGSCLDVPGIGAIGQFISTLAQQGMANGAIGNVAKIRIVCPQALLDGSGDPQEAFSRLFSRYSDWLDCRIGSKGLPFDLDSYPLDTCAIRLMQDLLAEDASSSLLVFAPRKRGREATIIVESQRRWRVPTVSEPTDWQGILSVFAICLSQIQMKKVELVILTGTQASRILDNMEATLLFKSITVEAVKWKASKAFKKSMAQRRSNPCVLIVATKAVQHSHTEGVKCTFVDSLSPQRILKGIFDYLEKEARNQMTEELSS